MTPDAILAGALADGLTVWPDGDLIRVKGPAPARARWLPLLKEHKPALLILLWTEALREHFEERAAILEYDGGLSHAEAEEQAKRSTALLARNMGAPWAALRQAVRDLSLPDTPHPVTHTPYPLPEWATTPDGQAVIPQGVNRHATR
jgi:hypothetical protein